MLLCQQTIMKTGKISTFESFQKDCVQIFSISF